MRLILVLLLAAFTGAAQEYDLLIRDARVIDGTGSPWFKASIAISDGRIAALGELREATGKREIQAGGRVLAPGFIDVHTHIEGSAARTGIEQFPNAANFITDGVTTLLTGNCGGSAADLAKWFRERESSGIGPNVASLIGHNTVRREVMGTEQRQPTTEELARMERLVDRAMADGAVGLSTGLIYVPGTYATSDEVIALAKVAARHGGVYSSHIRNEGNHVLRALEEAAQVGKQADLRVEISHLKLSSRKMWGQTQQLLDAIEKYRREGVDIVADQYPYDRSSTQLDTTVPSWALAGGREAFKSRIADPDTRSRIAQEMRESLGDQGFTDYSYATVASCAFDPAAEGKTITEIAASRSGTKSVDAEIATILDLVAKGPVQMVFHKMSEADVGQILKYPLIAVASDGYIVEPGAGVPHPRSFGTRARILAEYVRNRKILTLEEAVRRMTSLPARTFEFHDRGLVRPGFAADLVLFDPDRIADRSTYSKPHQFSEGFALVLVNGIPVVEESKPTNARPGKILRHRR